MVRHISQYYISLISVIMMMGLQAFGSLYHPGAYNFNVPLFDTPMDEPLGDYIPPDDLPDIPFTPPEPEPDNEKRL